MFYCNGCRMTCGNVERTKRSNQCESCRDKVGIVVIAGTSKQIKTSAEISRQKEECGYYDD